MTPDKVSSSTCLCTSQRVTVTWIMNKQHLKISSLCRIEIRIGKTIRKITWAIPSCEIKCAEQIGSKNWTTAQNICSWPLAVCSFILDCTSVSSKRRGVFFFIFNASISLNSGEVFIVVKISSMINLENDRSLSAFKFDQLWPIHQWRCEEIDSLLRRGDDLLLSNSTSAIICPSKHLNLCNKRIPRPIFGTSVLYTYPNNGFPLASTHSQVSRHSILGPVWTPCVNEFC